MRNAKLIVAVGIASFALGACHRHQPSQDQNIAIDEGVPDNQVAADNAQIETLPADESSTTPSNQLQNGFDNPDVNDVGTDNSQ
ncbi:MAG TPA: hypothetical protein VLM36_05870 [Sphingomicrobium sp.]|nr:hypothetical protein [Sphingomicrobium sp.]